MYSELMAERATGYVFWLTSGDATTRRYFPDVDMGMMERIWGQRELPNLRSTHVPGVVVLNAYSTTSSIGLTCDSDTQSKNKLVSINNNLIYVCCDVPLTGRVYRDLLTTYFKVILNGYTISYTILILCCLQLYLILQQLLVALRSIIQLHS